MTEKIAAMASDATLDKTQEEKAFRYTFAQLAGSLEDNSFKKFDSHKERFLGGFLISAFEVLALGIGNNYENYQNGIPHQTYAKKQNFFGGTKNFLKVLAPAYEVLLVSRLQFLWVESTCSKRLIKRK